jgi:Skp family chaperone for outer membrane proteins
MQKIFFEILVLALIAIIGCATTAGDKTKEDFVNRKVALVDFQRVLEISVAGKSAKAELDSLRKDMEDELTEIREEIKAGEKKLEREGLIMSNEMRAEKEREIRINIIKFISSKERYESEFKAYEAKLVNNIRKEISEITKEMWKSGEYFLILEKTQTKIVIDNIPPNAIDITDKVIQLYNAKYLIQ